MPSPFKSCTTFFDLRELQQSKTGQNRLETVEDRLEEFINNYPQAGVQLVISLASLLSKRLRSVTRRLIEEAELAVVRATLLVDS
jgi:hypothetical protein